MDAWDRWGHVVAMIGGFTALASLLWLIAIAAAALLRIGEAAMIRLARAVTPYLRPVATLAALLSALILGLGLFVALVGAAAKFWRGVL